MQLLRDLLEGKTHVEPDEVKLPAVIYGGRFQPFHKGHYAVYRRLCHLFGTDAVWIATSNKTNFDPKGGDISPFTFAERKEIMVQLYNIDPDHIVQCKNPTFSPAEILRYYKGPTVCIMAVGSKDVDRYRNSRFFSRYPMRGSRPAKFSTVRDDLSTVDDRMYYVVEPLADGGISGTKVRDELLKADHKGDYKRMQELFKEFFGQYDPDIRDLILSKLKQIEPEDEQDDKPLPKEPK